MTVASRPRRSLPWSGLAGVGGFAASSISAVCCWWTGPRSGSRLAFSRQLSQPAFGTLRVHLTSFRPTTLGDRRGDSRRLLRARHPPGRRECRRSCAWESAHTEGCKSLPGGASRQTTERNCVLAIRAWRATGSERIVRRTAGVKTTATRTRYGLMRLTRLRAMSEVRSTAASPPGEAGAKPVQNAKHRRNRGAWGGWRRNVRKCVCLNRGDLSWCWKEQGRSQSPHSSRETGNDRGAKGGRKVEA